VIFSTLEDILATDFEAAIFDFDGTIAHTHHIWKLVDQEFFESRGIPYTPEIGKILSPLRFRRNCCRVERTQQKFLCKLRAA